MIGAVLDTVLLAVEGEKSDSFGLVVGFSLWKSWRLVVSAEVDRSDRCL